MSTPLFPPQSLPPYVRYERLFEHLPKLATPARASRRGRRRMCADAILVAHVYRALRGMARMVDIAFELQNNPCILKALGFEPLREPPSRERFSAFLHDTDNCSLQAVHHELVSRLIQSAAIAPAVLAIDSCPIPVPVKENNLKTGLRKNRFDKSLPPRGDPEAGLGVLVHWPEPTAKKLAYFWGYRNHMVSDAQSEIPLWETTLPANLSEVPQAIPLLKSASQTYRLSPQAVVGDAEYDVEKILDFIVSQLHARPYIPANQRRSQAGHYHIVKDQILCQADLPMIYKGRMTVKNITYIQYVCPLHYRQKLRQRYLFCPARHPKYIEQKGCNALIRLSPTVRSSIPYGSQEFRQYFHKRVAAERTFSRLLGLAMQKPTVRGLKAMRNYCTIAHITTCLVALAAHKEGHNDKLRFVRTLVPHFMT